LSLEAFTFCTICLRFDAFVKFRPLYIDEWWEIGCELAHKQFKPYTVGLFDVVYTPFILFL